MQYMEIRHHASFFIGVFLLRRGAVIPMHNHPHMTVIRPVVLRYGRCLPHSIAASCCLAGRGSRPMTGWTQARRPPPTPPPHWRSRLGHPHRREGADMLMPG